jgi:hypothetical protein
MTALLLSTVIYFLATLAVGHSEIRYGLPMQALLVVFQAVGVWDASARLAKLEKRSVQFVRTPGDERI